MPAPDRFEQMSTETHPTTTEALEALYAGWRAKERHPTAVHLPTLRKYAEGCEVAVELGCQRGASAVALLLGAKRVISVDLVRRREADELAAVLGERWDYWAPACSLEVELPEHDLLFVDSLHTYAQVKGELERHADRTRRWLVFHDTVTFGSVAAKGDEGLPCWHMSRGQPIPAKAYGIMPAILEWMAGHREWYVEMHDPRSHGLLVLGRR